ncbi:aromatic acid decarboxylase, partial [Vibrio parahaemolyticus]
MHNKIQPSQKKAITLALTGASGAPYGLRLLECLVAADYHVYVLISSAARVVMATEHNLKLPSGPDAAKQALVEHLNCDPNNITVCGKDDWFSPVASGSAAPKQMVVCPCSAGS